MKNFPSLFCAIIAMVVLVGASNYYVQFPINNWLTWGALTYPMTYFVTELTNYFHGPKTARRIVYVGFAIALVVSVWLSSPRIALASGTAFLVSQLLDIMLFNRLRRSSWLYGAIFASFCISIADSSVFFIIAFLGEPLPLISLTIGDCAIKFILDVAMLCPARFTFTRKLPAYKIS